MVAVDLSPFHDVVARSETLSPMLEMVSLADSVVVVVGCWVGFSWSSCTGGSVGFIVLYVVQ